MEGSRSRPGPLSCNSCRVKKLRCNRVQPCSNCSARSITCNFLVPPRRVSRAYGSVVEDIGLSKRVQRLEAIIEPIPAATVYPTDSALHDSSAELQNSEATSSHAAAIEAFQAERHEDAQSLESVGTRDNTILLDLSNDLHFEVKSVDEVLQTSISITGRPNASLICLPIYQEAVILLHSYESTVDHVCRILHIPTIRSRMRSFYLELEKTQPVPTGQAALLLAIFALATFFFHPLHTGKLLSTERHSICLSKAFSKAALDVLDHSRRTISGTLEDVQAHILTAMVIFHLDGFSARGRLLSSTAIAMARDLRLHQLDAEDTYSSDEGLSSFRLIDLETKRRVFWYLASTDWLQSMVSGPEEGMYYLHVHHLNVKLPRNVSDDELCMSDNSEATADSQPTGMTYFLQRVRLAHLCRRMADAVPVTTSSLVKMPYQNIIALDQDLLSFLSTLPYFFKLDADSQNRARILESVYPNLGLLRYLITQAAHSRRCKLHQKFLLRQSTDPRYAYSRGACLESARTVILSFEKLTDTGCSWNMVARMGTAVHYLHLALVVFVMDLCCNGDAADGAEIKVELQTILQRLEGIKHVSLLLQRSLSSLYGVLQKNNVYLVDSTISSNNPLDTWPATQAASIRSSNAGNTGASDTAGHSDYLGSAFDTFFDRSWSPVAQIDPNADVWDRMFCEFDRQFL